ncbi:Transposase, TnpA family [Agrobacterium sp. DSM 25558]|uniref:DUF4158 domain-containing protein n=1 Tax=Agrobacterium sp. DSM 25558 TaxID=1907665 RepID=UPI0009726524|nr:DUF4158 domain-containing protein [Agrobacterium sp. DSM 25558]SCX32439.1 Transposase, TnpA family [Agrobacterium sp. DSM 25558]
MAKRKLLKDQDRRKLVDIPLDEDSLIRHYSLSLADRLEIDLRRRNHNRLGFAIQLCLMRYPGLVLLAEETPPRAMLRFVADQIGGWNFLSFRIGNQHAIGFIRDVFRHMEVRVCTTRSSMKITQFSLRFA